MMALGVTKDAGVDPILLVLVVFKVVFLFVGVFVMFLILLIWC